MKKTSFLGMILLALTLVLLVGCNLFRSENKETSTPSPSDETVRLTATSAPLEPPAPGGNIPLVTPTQDDTVTLVLWTSEDYAPTSETEGGMQLLEQLQAFQQDNNVDVDVILKKRSGSGGLLDFLTTASKAAPSVLPDLITLSNVDLYRASQAGLLQPLDGLVSPELLDGQFDFAVSLTRWNDSTMGVLYQADVQHLVYDTVQAGEPPASWHDLYSSTVPFAFSPAVPSDGVNGAILIQYLAVGGQLTDQADQPTLDQERLTEALEFFDAARQAQVIPRSVLDLTDTTTAWATYRSGGAGMVQAPASIYLAERASLRNAGFAPLPLRTPDLATIGHGWALAIVTKDEARQELATALIEHLLTPENNGAWTQASGRLPPRDEAFDFWQDDDAYTLFIRDLLAQAQAAPNPDLAVVVAGPLTTALTNVLSGQATPAEAAEAAVQAVKGE